MKTNAIHTPPRRKVHHLAARGLAVGLLLGALLSPLAAGTALANNADRVWNAPLLQAAGDDRNHLFSHPAGITPKQAAAAARSEVDGKIISVKPLKGNGGYAVRVLVDGGRVVKVVVDAKGRVRAK